MLDMALSFLSVDRSVGELADEFLPVAGHPSYLVGGRSGVPGTRGGVGRCPRQDRATWFTLRTDTTDRVRIETTAITSIRPVLLRMLRSAIVCDIGCLSPDCCAVGGSVSR
jgi:hypothetical protein